ncbi:MAG: cupin domain-containing protein [Candidatus Acidiferrales bacterium]|jgi:quercetin dioxygenase-like cupin family protein
MYGSRKLLSFGLVALGMATAAPLGSARAPRPDLDPAALKYTLPDQIKWVEAPNGGAATAVLVGDPSKPGLYIVLTKWHAHHNSRPHFHPNDRYITVLSGTWWVNTGTNYDLDHMVPMPAGSYVVHYGGQVHYDGAKDGDAVLEIVGMGPATSTSAEKK